MRLCCNSLVSATYRLLFAPPACFDPLQAGHLLTRLLHHLQIPIHRRPAQLTDSRQLADVHLLRDVRRIVPVKDRRNVVLCQLSSADSLALGFRILHAASDSGTNDGQLQFCEHRAHLNKRLAH